MKIAYTVGSLSGGGAERVVSRLANEMHKMGHEVAIFLIADSTVSYPIVDGVKIYPIQPKIQIRGLRYLFRQRAYKKAIKRFAPDVVVSFTAAVNIFVLSSLKNTKMKIIVSERNNPYVDPVSEKARKKRDKLYEKADGLVFQTADAQAYFSRTIQAKGIVVANPLEEGLPLPFEGEREKRIVTVGRLEPQKNQRLLIDAFAKIATNFPAHKLEIYGEGKLRNELQAYVEALGLKERVFLKGYHKDIIDKIYKAELFVLPSNYEGMSNALMEAMAIGLPVISTDHPIGGAKELIENEINGLLVPVNNVEALMEAMTMVLTNQEVQKKYSTNAIELKKSLFISEITNKWLEFCNKIINRGC